VKAREIKEVLQNAGLEDPPIKSNGNPKTKNTGPSGYGPTGLTDFTL
jgi:hypothetical protein